MTSTRITIVLGLFLAAGCNPMLSPYSHLPIDPLLPEVAAFIAADKDMFGFDDAPDLEASLTLGRVHSRLVPTEAFLGTVADSSGLEPDGEAFVVVYQHGVA